MNQSNTTEIDQFEKHDAADEAEAEFESRLSEHVSGILMESFSLIGFAFNLLLLVYFSHPSRLKKEPASVFVVNLILTDCCHLLMILTHIGVELIYKGIDWPIFELLVDYGATALWYSSLFNIFAISLTRYLAVVKFDNFSSYFTLKSSLCLCFFGWLCFILIACLP